LTESITEKLYQNVKVFSLSLASDEVISAYNECIPGLDGKFPSFWKVCWKKRLVEKDYLPHSWYKSSLIIDQWLLKSGAEVDESIIIKPW
jgi:hypothetical protein